MDDYALVLNAGFVKPEVLRLAAARREKVANRSGLKSAEATPRGGSPPPGTILDATDI